MAPDPAGARTWWLYLLLCEDSRTYTGIARDVDARYAAHVQGKGGRFTRANKPIAILGMQPFADRSAASRAEYALKQLRRPEKLAWAQQQSLVSRTGADDGP
jgi:putative endonuclease